MTNPEVRFVDNTAEHRFEAHVGDRLAGFVLYEVRPSSIVMVHTEIDPEFEGHGIGGQLAKWSLDEVRRKGLSVVPTCPFIRSYIRHHRDYQDLLETAPGAASP